jgi:FkbM family methyltransferase
LAIRQNIALTDGEIKFSKRLAQFGLNVIDAGARTDIAVAQYFQSNEKSQIYLIEPNPKFAKILNKKITKFKLLNTKVLQIALGLEESEVIYFKNSQSLLPRRVYGQKHDRKRLRNLIKVTTLDKLVNKEIIEYPLFLKTDLEMYDFLALSGGINAINELSLVVQFELGLETESLHKRRKILDFLALFTEDWNFFVLHDSNNAYLMNINSQSFPLIPLSLFNLEEIEDKTESGLTFNLVAIRDNLEHQLFDLILQ